MALTTGLNFIWYPTHRHANSYASLDRADEYFLQRPNSGNWSDVTADTYKARALMIATRAIDSLGLRGRKYINYNDDQRLHFPLHGSTNATGTVDSATTTTLVDSDLSGDTYQDDDFWNWGAVRIKTGTGAGQVRGITDFVESTGTLTVDTAWSTTPDTTSEYELIFRIPDEIFYACCEIAYTYMPDANSGVIDDGSQRARLQAQGVKSFNIGKFSETYTGNQVNGYNIPAIAMQWLSDYLPTGIY